MCVRVCVYACKCLSVPEQAEAACSCLVDTLSSSSSSLFVSDKSSSFVVFFSFASRRLCFFRFVLSFKSVLPQRSQIGWKYRSGGSARMRRAPLGLYCPPARLCSGRTGTAGGSLRCSHLLQLPGPRLQPCSETARILQTGTGRKSSIKTNKRQTRANNFKQLAFSDKD